MAEHWASLGENITHAEVQKSTLCVVIWEANGGEKVGLDLGHLLIDDVT